MEIVRVVNLSKKLGYNQILNSISFSIQAGEFVGLIGPNGAGKTTLLKCITGQHAIPEQCVHILQHDVVTDTFAAKQSYGFAYDPSILPNQLTGKQFIKLIASIRSIDSENEDIVFITELLSLNDKLNSQIGTYSQGMKQKLSIICALIGKPPLIIFDESLNGLDPISSYRLKNYLKEITEKKESTVILSSHLIDSIEKYCSKVIMLHEGEIKKTWLRDELIEEKATTKKDLEQLFIDLISKS